MSPEAKVALIGIGVIVVTSTILLVKLLVRRAPMKVKKAKFQRQWHNLQKYCKNKATWPEALVAADQLLDKALVKKGFKGKNTGERLVAAQRKFTDNDAVWYSHKLTRKVEEKPDLRLKESDVKDALRGFAQALKDLGAL